jgi:2'-5' RNA ligase
MPANFTKHPVLARVVAAWLRRKIRQEAPDFTDTLRDKGPRWSGEKQAAGKYEHIDFKPPVSVARAAERGLEYRRKQTGDKAGLSTGEAAAQGIGSGVQRAVNLKNRDTLSPATARRMHNFFSRHQKNKAIDPKHRGEPWKDKGYVAWLLWGGDPGRAWAAKIVRQMDAADEKGKKAAFRRASENEPTDPDLWGRAKAEARKRFDVYPSAYALGWAVQWYDRHGGGWRRKRKAAHSTSRCMEKGCEKAPEVECIWAEGRGRAWHCQKHHDAWVKQDAPDNRDIIKQRKIPDGVVGPKYGEYPTKKQAKATGKKTGDGEHVGLFIPLPKDLAKKFPPLGKNDPSPSHVTFLYVGDCKKKRDQKVLVDTLRDSCRRWWPEAKATLGELDYFDHEDKERRVPHVSVSFDKDLEGFKHRVRQELEEKGIKVEDSWPDFKPHVTLAYLPGSHGEWRGRIPKGSWEFDEMEIWGLPKIHKLKLGPSIYKISDRWLRERLVRAVAARHLVRKIAGWWAITPGNPGINVPPVDKGGLMNAIPGVDPSDARYNGDGPADHMDGALKRIDLEYLMEWGRPVTKEELRAVFDFCSGPIQEDGSRTHGLGHLNEWFIELAEWLGKHPDELRIWQFDNPDLARNLRRLWIWRPLPREHESSSPGPPGRYLEPFKEELRFLLDPSFYKKDPGFTYEGYEEAVEDLSRRLGAELDRLDSTLPGSARPA